MENADYKRVIKSNYFFLSVSALALLVLLVSSIVLLAGNLGESIDRSIVRLVVLTSSPFYSIFLLLSIAFSFLCNTNAKNSDHLNVIKSLKYQRLLSICAIAFTVIYVAVSMATGWIILLLLALLAPWYKVFALAVCVVVCLFIAMISSTVYSNKLLNGDSDKDWR